MELKIWVISGLFYKRALRVFSKNLYGPYWGPLIVEYMEKERYKGPSEYTSSLLQLCVYPLNPFRILILPIQAPQSIP